MTVMNMPPPRPTIPIVGMRYQMCGWYPTAVLLCKCATPQALNLVGFGGIGQCGACRAAYRLSRAVVNHVTGEIGLEIQEISLHEQPPTPNGLENPGEPKGQPS